MSKRSLSLREKAAISQLWIITKEEKDKLDRFFLCHDNWNSLAEDISFSEDEGCFCLLHEGVNFRMIFLTPIHRCKVCKELGLSFRVNWMSSFNYVVVKEWKDTEIKQPAAEPAKVQ